MGAQFRPRVESRRATHELLNEKSIYEPNLNTSFTRLDPGDEIVHSDAEKEGLVAVEAMYDKRKKKQVKRVDGVPEYFKKTYHNSGVQGGAYYQSPKDYYDDR